MQKCSSHGVLPTTWSISRPATHCLTDRILPTVLCRRHDPRYVLQPANQQTTTMNGVLPTDNAPVCGASLICRLHAPEACRFSRCMTPMCARRLVEHYWMFRRRLAKLRSLSFGEAPIHHDASFFSGVQPTSPADSRGVPPSRTPAPRRQV